MVTDHRHGSSQSLSDRAISSGSVDVTVATGTTLIIAAPGVGRKIVVTGLEMTDTSAAANSLALKSGTTTKGTLRCPASGLCPDLSQPIELAENSAFNITATGAGVGVCQYVVVPV